MKSSDANIVMRIPTCVSVSVQIYAALIQLTDSRIGCSTYNVVIDCGEESSNVSSI